jgi:hypothetical protein
MDRAILQQGLEEAERDVERTQRNIASQHQMIATLENGGHDASMARQLLKLFEVALAMHVANRDWLIKELEESSKPRRG